MIIRNTSNKLVCFLKNNKELVTLLFLLTAILTTSLIGSNKGMNWSDRGQIFYFGNRIVNGEIPYRDFPYQTGFIPLFVDAAFQDIFGELYLSSLLVGLLVKIATFPILYIVLRQFVNRLTSANICLGLSLINTQLISGGNHFWVNLFLAIAFLFVVIAFHADRENKRSRFYVVCLGFTISFIVGIRQSDGLLFILLVLLVSLAYSFRNPRIYLLNLTLPFSIGLTLGFGATLGFLGYHQTIRAAFYELFIAASERKNFSAISGLLDAVLGGSLYSNSFSNMVIKMILFNLIPILITIIILIAIGLIPVLNKQKITNLSKVSFLSIPTLVIIGIAIKNLGFLNINYENHNLSQIISEIMIYDLPRVFFSIVFSIGCIFPQKIKSYLGISPIIFSILTALTLGKVWANQMSWLGRDYITTTMLIFLVMLITLSSTRISIKHKKCLSLVFLLVAVSVFSKQLLNNSLGQEVGSKYANYSLQHPMTKLIRVSKEKAVTFSMLRQNIKPNDSCFIYGSAPILYTLLQCKNPIDLPLAYADALTLTNARKSVSELNANPPQWIIETGQLPSLDKKLKKSYAFYDFFQQPAPQTLHRSLQKLMENYQLVTTAKEQLADIERLETRDLDRVTSYRLFKLKE